MPLPLIPLAVAGTVAYIWYKKNKVKGLTPERKAIFDAAMKKPPDKAGLEKLAAAFDSEGLTEQAAQLRARGKLRDLPPEQKAARKDAYQSFLRSKDPNIVDKAADTFEKQGATANAAHLRQYAAALRRQSAAVK